MNRSSKPNHLCLPPFAPPPKDFSRLSAIAASVLCLCPTGSVWRRAGSCGPISLPSSRSSPNGYGRPIPPVPPKGSVDALQTGGETSHIPVCSRPHTEILPLTLALACLTHRINFFVFPSDLFFLKSRVNMEYKNENVSPHIQRIDSSKFSTPMYQFQSRL